MYLVTGCLQGTLLVMGIYFEYTHRKRERKEAEDRMEQANGHEQPSEQTPLLNEG